MTRKKQALKVHGTCAFNPLVCVSSAGGTQAETSPQEIKQKPNEQKA